MTEAAAAPEIPLPRWVPAALSFVAGYVDSYTFLALFGLFVAQVTGSFVTASAELVSHDIGIIGKSIAILAFLLATAATTALIGLTRHHRRNELPWMLGFETVLLAVFCLLMLAGPPPTGANDWHGILAGAFAAMAMGTQSVIVRLLMRGIPQTNVMTGNMTQLGIASTELLLAWRRYRRDPGNAAHLDKFNAERSQLLIVLAIAIGFIVGAGCGAVAFAVIGLRGTVLAVFLVGVLTLWALRRGPAR